MAIIGYIFVTTFIGIAVLCIGIEEESSSSIAWGVGLIIGALALWFIMALKLRNDNKRSLLICLLLSLIPWDI